MAISLHTSEYNVIYVVSRDSIPNALKIGKTNVKTYDPNALAPNCPELIEATKQRLAPLSTYGVTDLHILHTEIGWFVDNEGRGVDFIDTDVHNILINSHYEKLVITSLDKEPNEWYKVDLETAKKAIAAVKAGQAAIDGPAIPKKKPEIHFRDEQERAITETQIHYKTGRKMLWNAKMRFGKTLCALELIRRQGFKKTLILTHRPTVKQGWFVDYHNIQFENYEYGSKNGKKFAPLDEKDRAGKDIATLLRHSKENDTNIIYFASMQDLRGSRSVSDKGINKNDDVFKTNWDLIILDEAHEGTQTPLGQNVIRELTRKKRPYLLYLSGTPYNILSQFTEQEIFTWDYPMEQEAKEKWPQDHDEERNPYEGLAKLNIYTYNIADAFKLNNYSRSEDDYFNFSELFRTWTGDEQKDQQPMGANDEVDDFVHKEDVRLFLDLLCQEEPVSYYPYSNEDFRNALSHTLWMVPGVKQASALEKMINDHPLHRDWGVTVINVAGNGSAIENTDSDDTKKIERVTKDALEKVQNAIKANKRTITLSCGRLTTGVSVPEWTGVFMLSGGYSTSAASYMQTIFRSQTPYKNGAIKSNCYAFDFAPDRTLTVIEEFVGVQRRNKNRQTDDGNKAVDIENLLRFCPVVAMEGGKEIPYDATKLVKEVNRVYTEKVINSGFKRGLNKNIANFSEEDHKLLAAIGALIGGSKNVSTRNGKVVLTNEGLNADETKGTKKITRKSTSGNSVKTKKPKNEEAEKRNHSQQVLEQIFVRFPLLLFGSVANPTGLTLRQLISNDVIDNESWEEFMPKKFTKEMMLQIAHLVKIDVLISSAAEIIEETKKADALPIEHRVMVIAEMLSRFHFPDKETVLTPWRVVNMHMSDTIGGFDFFDAQHKQLVLEPRWVDRGKVTQDVFGPTATKIMEINSKSGVYPLYLAYTLYRKRCEERLFPIETDQEKQQVWEQVLNENLFVLCKTKMAKKITERVLRGYTDATTHCEVYPDLVSILKGKSRAKKNKLVKDLQSRRFWKIDNNNKSMKFNAIVGNPPYQDVRATENSTTTNAAFASAIYPAFIDVATKLNPQYISLITPSRWMTKTGQGISDSWVDRYINCNHFISICDFTDASDCFTNIEIKGGVNYFLYSQNYDGGCKYTLNSNGNTIVRNEALNSIGLGIVIRDFKASSIFQKLVMVEGKYMDNANFSDLVSPQHFFDKDGLLGSSWSGFVEEQDDEHPIKYYCNKKLIDKGFGWIRIEDIPKNTETIPLHKVFIPEAGGSGNDAVILGVPFYGEPNSICSQTYICIGYDANKHNFSKRVCENIITYVKTKFFRYLVSVKKKTQHTSAAVYQLVPLQDFSKSWTDEMLYKKYDLSQDEIRFIESMIKAME